MRSKKTASGCSGEMPAFTGGWPRFLIHPRIESRLVCWVVHFLTTGKALSVKQKTPAYCPNREKISFSIMLKAWLSLVPVRCLFVRVGDPEDRCFVQMLPDDLHADGQSVGVKAARNGEPGEPGQVGGDGEDVRKVHLERILSFLPDFEGCCRRGRRDDGVACFESVFKVFFDQGSHFLRLQVVSVVVAGRQGVGAEHDAPLHLRSEPLLSGLHVGPAEVCSRNAQTVLHAVVAGEIRAGFSRGQDRKSVV